MLSKLMTCWCLALLAVVVGCTGGAIYDAGSDHQYAAVLTPKETWRASGDLRNPQAAVDGDLSTAARSEVNYTNATLTIDLGKPCLFAMVVIDHGSDMMGFCRKVALLTSNDGRNFSPCYTTGGTKRLTTMCLTAPVMCRYIRLQAVAPGDRPWTIAEVYLY